MSLDLESKPEAAIFAPVIRIGIHGPAGEQLWPPVSVTEVRITTETTIIVGKKFRRVVYTTAWEETS